MNKLKVLIVEDENKTQKLFELALSQDIFKKEFCVSGIDALTRYEKWKPDIIILDVYIPDMTGYSILKKIREDFEDAKTTIIMSSSLKDEEHIKDCIKYGIQGYIIKPFRYKKIGSEIMKCYQMGEKTIQKVDEAINYKLDSYDMI